VVRVLDIRGGTVKLGFEVDAKVPVHRWEVWERIQAGQGPVAPADGPPAPVR
jgi:sRNA-binding carbon storage regulator CsrA